MGEKELAMPRQGQEQLSPEQMDEYAECAAEELVEQSIGTIAQVADWWRRWYLLAGHKRLGRIIMRIK